MTVTLTYDPLLSRVRVDADGLGAATHALVERSTNSGVTWVPVRGALSATVSGAELVPPVDDYEFASDTLNEYRVRTLSAGIAFEGVGAAAHGVDGASVMPPIPAEASVDELMLLWCAIRNSGTGTPNTPTGWSMLLNAGNARLFGKIHTGSETNPTVSFAGGASGASTSAQICAFSGATITVAAMQSQLNGSAQNIAYPSLSVPIPDALVLYLGWKASDWGSVATVQGATEIGEPDTGIGSVSGNGLVWDRLVQTDPDSIQAGSFVVTGGVSAISRGAVLAIVPTTNTQTSSITPSLNDQFWLKVPARPFLNRPVTVLDFSDIERPDRGGLFDVVGRSMPVAVTDVATSRRYTLTLSTNTPTAASDLDLVIASGDLLFLHAPPSCPVPTGYWKCGQLTQSRRTVRGVRRYFDLPLTEVAAPAPDVSGSTSTWATVLATYATWQDVLNAHTTWADLLELIGDPTEVIVMSA